MALLGRKGSAKLKPGRKGSAKLKSAFESFGLAGSNVRTSFGAGLSFRMNFPVSRPRSGIALADVNDSALATTIIGRYGIFIKPRNTVFSCEPHGKKTPVHAQF